jgi:hypothetical protein
MTEVKNMKFSHLGCSVMLKCTDVSEVRAASVIKATTLMMEAVRFNVTTRRYNPEDSKLNTRRR